MLYNYSKLKAERTELKIRYEELKDSIGLKSVSYDNEGTSYGISKTTENQAIKVVEAKEKLQSFIKTKGFDILRIENLLIPLKEKERELIQYKYFEKRRIDTLPYLLDRTDRTCRRIERDALNQIYDVINLKVS